MQVRRSAGLWPGGLTNPPGFYDTRFPIVQNPLSYGGRFLSPDPNTTPVQVSATGRCHGTQTGSGAFNDSQAWMWGTFGNNVRQTATIFLTDLSSTPNREVELLFGMSVGPTFTTGFGTYVTYGYEFNLHSRMVYANLGRFAQAAVDSATFIPTISNGSVLVGTCQYNTLGQPVFQFSIDGNFILWTGGANTVTDTNPSPPKGQPGLGFFVDTGGANNTFGFSSYTVVSL